MATGRKKDFIWESIELQQQHNMNKVEKCYYCSVGLRFWQIHVLRSLEFIYTIFAVTHIHMCVRVCVRTQWNLNGVFNWTQISYIYYRPPLNELYWLWWLFSFVGCMFFLTGVQNTILIHYGLWSQTIISVWVSKQCILLRSNLLHVL